MSRGLGLSKVEQERLKAVQTRLQEELARMLKEEENRYCADCDAKGPRWASWNLGLFLCIRCAGIHRNLGVHISKVKSVNLDSWTPEQTQSMRVMGNSAARGVYEANIPEHFRRPQSDSSMEAFIRAKYDAKRYILKGWVKPPVDEKDLPCWSELQDIKNGVAGKKKAAKVALGSAPLPASAARASAPVKAPTFPKAAAQPAPPQPPAAQKESAVNDLLGLSTPAAAAQPAAVPASGGFADLLGLDSGPSPIHNAGLPPNASAPAFAAPAQGQGQAPAQPPAQGSNGALLLEASKDGSAATSPAGPKSNTDIMALFGSFVSAPAAQPTPQPPQAQQSQAHMNQGMPQGFGQPAQPHMAAMPQGGGMFQSPNQAMPPSGFPNIMSQGFPGQGQPQGQQAFGAPAQSSGGFGPMQGFQGQGMGQGFPQQGQGQGQAAFGGAQGGGFAAFGQAGPAQAGGQNAFAGLGSQLGSLSLGQPQANSAQPQSFATNLWH